eukprot:TRINITY_DN1134_c0_g2_i1.p1 TRINITY_DN1134_c0_g2~~TRINITY_DN1134_c0_g2_i1.p1  ORF type:complete len:528 (+),score=59.33 TRINITY_DN1134_c0_g2_i1:60-1643(+)
MTESKREVLTILGVASVGIATAYYLRRITRKEQPGRIPDLRMPRGYFGAVHAMYAHGKDQFLYGLGRLNLLGTDPKVGISNISIFGQNNVMIRDPELAKEILTNNHQVGGKFGKSFRDSPFEFLIDGCFGNSLFFADDHDSEWALAHKLLSKPFSHRGVMAMMPTMIEQANKLVAMLKQDSENGDALYLYDYMVKMALETLAVSTMGTSLECFTQTDLPPFPVHFQGVINAVFDLMEWPERLWPLFFLTRRRIVRHVKAMHKIVDDIVERRMRNETSASVGQKDLLDIMLHPGDGPQMSAKGIRSQILGLLFAGHDSTAAALSSFIVFMIANPRVEAKVVDEIRRVVGDEELRADHLSKLTYLDWCLKETLRCLPPASNVERMAFDKDVMVAGKWRVARYEPINIDNIALHLDPETWGADAALFVPERWEKGAPHQYSYQPFSSGPRGCIGKEFTLLDQKIVAVKMLQNFTFQSLAPGSWKPRPGYNLVKATDTMAQPPKIGIDVEFNPRQIFAGASLPVILKPRAP